MQYFNLNPKPSKLPNREFSTFIRESYSDPLKKLGFTLDKVSSTPENTHDLNFHILEFSHDQVKPFRKDWLDAICIQDDDSQPNSTYTIYLGTLWVFIPFLP
jgi:hypothetical protein